MKIISLTVILLTWFSLIVLLSPNGLPTATPIPTFTPMPQATALAAELEATVMASLSPTATPDVNNSFDSPSKTNVVVKPIGYHPIVNPHGDLWLADGQAEGYMFVEIYRRTKESWQRVNYINNIEFVYGGGVRQIEIESSRIWFEGTGAVGAHGEAYFIFSFDGKKLQLEVEHGNSQMNGLSQLVDFDGDGVFEIQLDTSDYYVFTYADGIAWSQVDILRWNGKKFKGVKLTPLSASAPEKLRDLNHQAIQDITAGLWQSGQQWIQQAQNLSPTNEIIKWNAIYINTNAALKQKGADRCLLLNRLFYGDYDAVITLLKQSPQPLFEQKSFESCTPTTQSYNAAESTHYLAKWVTDVTTQTLALKPDMAAPYFLRAWATHLIKPTDPTILTDLQQAITLKPDEPLFLESLAYYQTMNALYTLVQRTDGVPLSIQPLPNQTVSNTPLWLVFSYDVIKKGQAPHFIALYRQNTDTWQEVGSVTLDKRVEIDLDSVKVVTLTHDRLWLQVQNDFADDFYDLLSFDGDVLRNELSLDFSQTSSDYVSVNEDVNQDGVNEVKVSHIVYLCAKCWSGYQWDHQLYYWHDNKLIEAKLTELPASAKPALRQLNQRALELAQAGLWQEAQKTLSQALILESSNQVIQWNKNLVDVYERNGHFKFDGGMAELPLIQYLFYGNYEDGIEHLKTYSMTEIFSPTTVLLRGGYNSDFLSELLPWIITRTTTAITVEPNLAPAYFMRGWATYLTDPSQPQAALPDLRQAQTLAPQELFYNEALAYLEQVLPITPTSILTPTVKPQ